MKANHVELERESAPQAEVARLSGSLKSWLNFRC